MAGMSADATSPEHKSDTDWRAELAASLTRVLLKLERARLSLAHAEIRRLEEQLELERARRRRGLFGSRF